MQISLRSILARTAQHLTWRLCIMKLYQEKIDEESESALEELSKSNIQFLYSPAADINFGSSVITVQSISIPLGKQKFLVIDNDWSDTPKEWHDYYFLQARIMDRPKDIAVKETENRDGWTYVMDHLSFHIGKQKKVTSVEILEDFYEGEEEGVRYDAGIVITLEDSTQVAIVREESITGFLQIATLPGENTELIGELRVRVKYHA